MNCLNDEGAHSWSTKKSPNLATFSDIF